MMVKKNDNFTSIRLPKSLMDEIKKVIKEPPTTHNTSTSFIEYAVRKQLEKTKSEIIEERQHREHMEAMDIK